MKKTKLLSLKLCYLINNIIDSDNYNDVSLRLIYLIEKAYVELKNNLNDNPWVTYPPLY